MFLKMSDFCHGDRTLPSPLLGLPAREAAVQGPGKLRSRVPLCTGTHATGACQQRQQDACLTKACVDYLEAARAAAIARRVFTGHLFPGSVLGSNWSDFLSKLCYLKFMRDGAEVQGVEVTCSRQHS